MSSRLAISIRVAPSRARADLTGPAAKKMQSPGLAPTWAASPSRSASVRFLATGPPSVPSSASKHVGQALVAALLGEFLPPVEGATRLRRSARHDDRTDVRRLEDPKGGVGEVLRAVDEFEAEAQVGLVGPEPPHRLGVGDARDRRR